MTVPAPALGLRERKKLETRAALHEGAVKLFSERGYNDTTVADIAESAGVSARTFFSYFPSKEAALFAPLDDMISDLVTGLDTRTDSTDSFAYLREWIDGRVEDFCSGDSAASGTINSLAKEHEFIAGHSLRYLERIGAALTDAIARDLPDDAPPGLAAICASATLAAIALVMPTGKSHQTEVSAAERAAVLTNLDQALEFMRAGIAGVLANHPNR